jgi:hypothetical protein
VAIFGLLDGIYHQAGLGAIIVANLTIRAEKYLLLVVFFFIFSKAPQIKELNIIASSRT